jgi:hypothetical protein
MKSFRIKFNRNKQWIDVNVWDVHPNTFQNWGGGRWAYFEQGYDSPREGKFGELHVVESGIREDTVAHEMVHVVWERFVAVDLKFIRRNEERFATYVDELVRKFYREYRKL